MKLQNNSNEIEIISQNVPNNALYRSEEECTDQESINQVPHLNQDIEWESDKNKKTSHIGEARDHPFPIR